MLHGDRVVPRCPCWVNRAAAPRTATGSTARHIEIAHADDYEAALERDGKVIATFELPRERDTRRARDRRDGGGILDPRPRTRYYDEVTALVEYPTVYEVQFETGSWKCRRSA